MTLINLEQVAETVVTTAARNGVRIVAKVPKLTTSVLMDIFETGIRTLKNLPHLPGSPDHGKMSVKALQTKAGGDIHAQEIDPTLIKEVQKDLKKRGIDFAIEHGHDGHTYVQFKGVDTDSLSHALKQAQAKLAKTTREKNEPEKKQTPAPTRPQTRADVQKTIKKYQEMHKKPITDMPIVKKGRSR